MDSPAAAAITTNSGPRPLLGKGSRQLARGFCPRPASVARQGRSVGAAGAALPAPAGAIALDGAALGAAAGGAAATVVEGCAGGGVSTGAGVVSAGRGVTPGAGAGVVGRAVVAASRVGAVAGAAGI